MQERVSAAWVTQARSTAQPGSERSVVAGASAHRPERYQIECPIGQGAWGRCTRPRTASSVAWSHSFLHIADDTRARRLFREARAQARIKHPTSARSMTSASRTVSCTSRWNTIPAIR